MLELWRNKRTGTYHWIGPDGRPICRSSSHTNPEYWEPATPKDSLPILMCQGCDNLYYHRYGRRSHAQTSTTD